MMNVSFLSASVSRSAGGIYESERSLALALHQSTQADVEVFGLEDEHTQQDLPEWSPLSPNTFEVWGPSAFGYAPGLIRALVESNTDVLHQHVLWMYPSVAALRWARKTGKPHIVTIHGMLDTWARRNAGWKKRLAGWLYEYMNLDAAACLQVNTASEREAVRDFGIDTPVCVVPNGVNVPSSEPASAPPWSERIPEENNVLLFLGRLHPKKGVMELLRGWDQVQPEGWSLAVVGWADGDYEKELEGYLHSAGVDNAHLLGPMFGEEKEAALHHADAFILPSYSEGLPMAVLEAWSYQLPVLMTPACNLEEGFKQGAALKILPEVVSIADGLDHLFSLSHGDRKTIGWRGRRLIEGRFTWPRIAEQMYDVYRWVYGRGDMPDVINLPNK